MEFPEHRQYGTFPRQVKIGLAAVILALFGGGLWYFLDQQALQRRAVEDNLWAIAKLKAGQISDWRRERVADALVLMDRQALVASVKRYLSGMADGEAAEIIRRLEPVKQRYDYENILLVDSLKKIRLTLEGAKMPAHSGYLDAFDSAVAEHRPAWTRIHTEMAHDDPHLSMVVPLFDHETDTTPVGALVLISDAGQFLYPLIQSWPTTSETAETLLVRRDGDDVLFLNGLRHMEDTALNLRIPLSRTDLPAAMAVSGTAGIVQGLDYRGEPVLAAILPVEDSSWYMVAKIDSAEAFAEWRFRSAMILVLLSSVLGLVVLAWFLLGQRNQKIYYRRLYRSEAELSRALRQHEATLRAIGDGVVTTDAHGCVEFMNPVAEEMTGWAMESARGKKLEEVFVVIDEKTGQPVEDPASAVVRENRGRNLLPGTLLRSRAGLEIPVAHSAAPIPNEEGGPVGAVLVFKDVSAGRRLQEQLAEARKMEAIGRLAGGTAHDYNNMLNIITGYSELGLGMVSPEEPLHKNFQEILTAARRSAGITRKLLAFARRQMSMARVVDLNETIREMLGRLDPVLGESIELVWRPGEALWPVKMDPAQLFQVLSNLCENSREAVDETGEVRLETENAHLDEAFCRGRPGSVPGDFVMVSMIDNGRGMDPEILDTVFEPFFTTKPFGESAGMGLAVAYGIIRQSNGFFDVESRRGEGSTFRFFLPRQVK